MITISSWKEFDSKKETKRRRTASVDSFKEKKRKKSREKMLRNVRRMNNWVPAQLLPAAKGGRTAASTWHRPAEDKRRRQTGTRDKRVAINGRRGKSGSDLFSTVSLDILFAPQTKSFNSLPPAVVAVVVAFESFEYWPLLPLACCCCCFIGPLDRRGGRCHFGPRWNTVVDEPLAASFLLVLVASRPEGARHLLRRRDNCGPNKRLLPVAHGRCAVGR
jgi:hypothetical protein